MTEKTGLLIKVAFLCLVMSCFCLQPANALDVNGVLDSDTRWTSADSPINITGDVRVDTDASLRIGPGVRVIFQSAPAGTPGYSLKIDGLLSARGTEKQPIRFTAADPAIPWGAVVFSDTSRDWRQDTSTGSIMEYCIIEYGGNTPESDGMIHTFNAMPLIARNAIRFSGAAGVSAVVSQDPAVIESLSGDIRMISNLIYNNAIGIRLAAEGGLIENNYFLNNTRAIVLQTRSNDVVIAGNTVVSSAPQLFGTGLQLVLADSANGITAYQWRQTAGPSVALSNPQSARTAFTAPDPGRRTEDLIFELTVTSENGSQAMDTVEVHVIGDNPPPTASAGADQNVQLPQAAGESVTVTLSAEGSFDPYLGITRYVWEQINGPGVNLAGANTINPSFTLPASVSAGDRMSFQVTVTDQTGLSSTDQVNIIFYDDNVFPVAAAGGDRSVAQGARVNLDGTGSFDPDGSIAAYEWIQTNGPQVALNRPNTPRPDFEAPQENLSAEIVTFQLQVRDNGGLTDTDNISITVNGTLTADPGNDQTVSAKAQVVLDASASIDQNAAANIDIESNLLEMDNAEAGLFALTAAENASFNLNAARNNFKAVDNTGYIVYTYNWAHQAPQTISLPNNWWGTNDALIIEGLIYDQINSYELPAVKFRPFATKPIPGTGASLPYPPLANAGPDLETAADNAVTLNGSNSFDPNEIVRYQWQQSEGPAVDLKNADQAVADFIAPSGGEDGAILKFQLTVATDETFSHSDTVRVTITPDEDPPSVDADNCFIQSAAAHTPGKNLRLAVFIAGIIGGMLVLGISRRWRRFMPGLMILMTILLLTVSPAKAGYFAIGAGDGGDADEVNVTLETGAKDIRFKGQNLLFGMGLYFIPHSDDELPSSTISNPCPNEACIHIDTARKSTEVGLYGKLGAEILSTDLYVSAIGGFTAYTESELSRSPATNRVYEESSDSEIDALYGGGISYFIDYKWDVVLHVDVDNIRGVTGTIGLHW